MRPSGIAEAEYVVAFEKKVWYTIFGICWLIKEEIQRMRIRRIATSFLAGALLCACTACGGGKKSTNLETGMNYIENAEYDNALASFEAGEAAGEDRELIYRAKGIAYIGKMQYGDAVSSFLTALSCCDGTLTPLEYDINYYLATAYYKSGDYRSAFDTYSAILALKPKEETAYYLRGISAISMGYHDQAIADFDKAVSLNKSNYSMYIDIYLILDKYGFTQEGLEYLEDAMSVGSRNMSDYDKGRICYYMGDYENACLYLDSANKENTNETIVLELGKAYEATGDVNFAASIYVNYLSNYGDSAPIYNQLGTCKLLTGDYQAALEAIQSGIAMNNMDVMQTLKYNEIVAYEYLGDFKKACVLMESYLAAYPDDTRAVREYEFLSTR